LPGALFGLAKDYLGKDTQCLMLLIFCLLRVDRHHMQKNIVILLFIFFLYSILVINKFHLKYAKIY